MAEKPKKPPLGVPGHLRDTWFVPVAIAAELLLARCHPEHTPPESIPAFERDRTPPMDVEPPGH